MHQYGYTTLLADTDIVFPKSGFNDIKFDPLSALKNLKALSPLVSPFVKKATQYTVFACNFIGVKLDTL